MVARVITSQRSEAGESKLFIDDYRIPSLKEEPGFVGALFLAGREGGTVITITLWEDAASERASVSSSVGARDDAARMIGATFETADTYDVIAQVLPARA